MPTINYSQETSADLGAKTPALSSRGRRYVIAGIVLLSYAFLILWLTLHHEPWRDEADAWLLSRDNSFEGLFRMMGYSGTPMLWHLTLWPLAKSGLPYAYASMSILNACLGIAAAAIVLFCSPFSLPASTLILFSYFFSYEYPVIARSYQLSILLIFILAAMHRRRSDKPVVYSCVLALLANTNVHGLIVALSIGVVNVASLFLAKATPRSIAKFAIPISIGVILSVVQVLPPSDGQIPPVSKQPSWFVGIIAFKQSIVPSITNLNHGLRQQTEGQSVQYWPLIPTALAIAAVFIAIRRSRWALASTCIAWLGLTSLFVFTYTGFLRHWGFLVVVAIYALWIAKLDGQDSSTKSSNRRKYETFFTNAVFSLVLLLSVVTAVQAWISDTKYPFSGGLEAAKFIKDRNLDSLPIAAYRNYAVESVLPYLPGKKFFYPEIMSDGTHMLWNNRFTKRLDNETLVKRLNQKFGNHTSFLLIVSSTKDPAFQHYGFERVYRSKASVITRDERLTIFLRHTDPSPMPVSTSHQ